MQKLRVPSAQDVVRLICPTLEDTIEAQSAISSESRSGAMDLPGALRDPFSAASFLWTLLLKDAKRGEIRLEEQRTQRSRNSSGRRLKAATFNATILAIVPFFIRKDLSIRVDPLFFFVEGGRVKIFWLQPRRGYAPTLEGMALLAVMIRMTFGIDFEDWDLELLDLRAPNGEKQRVPRTLCLADLPSCDEEVMRLALERFAQAYDLVCEMDIKKPARRPRPDDRPSLFD